MVLTVRISMAPSLKRKVLFAVDTPHVGLPKLLESARPRKAIVVASPELAVRLSVSTATGGSGASNS